MENNTPQEVPLEELDKMDGAIKDNRNLRFGKFPEWKFQGWQVIGFVQKSIDPEVPLSLQKGWKSLAFGIFRVKHLPDEDGEIKSGDIDGFIIQFQFFLPFDNFGKL